MCISRFLAGVALLWLAESFAAEPKPTPVDQFCDPLPPGALARMGTVRWRHLDEGAMSGVRATLSPDGRLVATWNTAQSGTATVRVWTLADGKPVCEFPWDDATYRNDFRFTPDSKRLLTIRMNGAVRSHDAKTGQVLADTKPLFDPAGYPYGELLGGRWLLMHLKEPVLYELAADDQPKPVPLEKPEVGWDQLRWSAARPHGDTLVVVTRNNARAVGTTYVADRWDTRTGKLTGTAQLREKASGMMSVMSENGERFAAWKINPTEVNDTLLVWDTASGKLLAELPGGPRNGWGSITFSPDGKWVAADVGSTTKRMIRVWQVEGSKRLGEPEVPKWVHGFAVSPDGKTLLGWSWFGFVFGTWDLATGRRLSADVGHEAPVTSLVFTPDGKRLFSSSATTTDVVTIWDAATGRKLDALASTRRSPNPQGTGHDHTPGTFALTPGGAVVTTHSGNLVWTDAKTGREIRRIKPDELAEELVKNKIYANTAYELVVLITHPGTGKSVVCGLYGFGSHDGIGGITVSTQIATLYDADSGERIESRKYTGYRGHPQMAVSPDGTVARFVPGQEKRDALLLHSLFDGRGVSRLRLPNNGVRRRLFSPDGHTLVTIEPRRIRFWFQDDRHESVIRVWEVRSGRERASFTSPSLLDAATAFSADGRFLATARNDNAISVRELATGAIVAERKGFRNRVSTVAFRPDGKALASGHADGTTLVWDLSELPTTKPAATDRKAAWADLASPDAAKAHRAIVALSTDPECVAFLRTRLQPAPELPPGRVRQLVSDLGDRDFATREAATKALGKLGPVAEAELRASLGGELSAEQTDRIERVLNGLELVESDPDRLRELRCVEVLERTGSADARAVLAVLAKGAAGAGLTRDATQAVRRLSQPAR